MFDSLLAPRCHLIGFYVGVRSNITKGAVEVIAVPFTNYRDNFSPEMLAILDAAFNAAWDAVVTSGVACDQQKTRTALADAIVYFASEGETDPKRLKELALAALPKALSQ